MKTITIQIGNSDNKLTQREWFDFVRDIRELLAHHNVQIHFFGGAENWAPWQNAAWVIVATEWMCDVLKPNIAEIRAKYKQDSVAWTEGETKFI